MAGSGGGAERRRGQRDRARALLERGKRLAPGGAGPEVLDGSVGRPVDGGVERAEAVGVGGRVQRRGEERGDRGLLALAEQRPQPALALERARRARVLRPFDRALV